MWVKCSLDYSLCLVFTKTDPEIRIWVQIISLRSDLRRLGKKWEGRGKTHKGDIHEHITTGASGVQSPVDPLRDHVANTLELSHLQSKEIGRFIHKFPFSLMGASAVGMISFWPILPHRAEHGPTAREFLLRWVTEVIGRYVNWSQVGPGIHWNNTSTGHQYLWPQGASSLKEDGQIPSSVGVLLIWKNSREGVRQPLYCRHRTDTSVPPKGGGKYNQLLSPEWRFFFFF